MKTELRKKKMIFYLLSKKYKCTKKGKPVRAGGSARWQQHDRQGEGQATRRRRKPPWINIITIKYRIHNVHVLALFLIHWNLPGLTLTVEFHVMSMPMVWVHFDLIEELEFFSHGICEEYSFQSSLIYIFH